MNNFIRIISRKSVLAKIQAKMVGAAFRRKFPDYDIEYKSLETKGDFDQKLKLDDGSNIGIFTSDISDEVLMSKNNIAVHSWKDYPIFDNKDSKIYATLKRGDMRDILFLKNIKNLDSKNNRIRIMTSSPRRRYALKKNLKFLVPKKIDEILFEDVRGNINTRLNKFERNGSAHGFIVAKAAIDRILKYSEDNKQKTTIENFFKAYHWMIMPLSIFPTAPAQGAIGIEIDKENYKMIDLIKKINHKESYENVIFERNILSKYGGGCSQKIGVSVWSKNDVIIKSVFGLTESNNKLKTFEIISRSSDELCKNNIQKKDVFPRNNAEKNIFDRKKIKKNNSINKIKNSVVYLTRGNVLDDKPVFDRSCVIYTSGLKTWISATSQGYWVNGSCDSMGESEIETMPQIERVRKYHKLTFDSQEKNEEGVINLYYLINPNFPKDLKSRKEFYWMSFYSFQVAIKEYPELVDKNHSCGMGNTYKRMIEFFDGNHDKVNCYLSYEHWLSNFKDN